MPAIGYTTRSKVEKFLGRTFPEVDNTEFDDYISIAEQQINNHIGYNAQTTVSGVLQQSIVREKSTGKVDANGNLVVDVMKPPVAFDANNNPQVSLLEFNYGGIHITLNLTDGSNNAFNTLLEVSENRRKVYYPAMYFFPAISTVTPTAKVNLMSLRDLKFWVDISYVGGYVTVPGEITLAANMLAGNMLVNRDNPSLLDSYRQGSYSLNYGDSDFKVMKNVERLLQPFVRYGW